MSQLPGHSSSDVAPSTDGNGTARAALPGPVRPPALPPPAQRRRSHWWVWLIFLAVLGGGGWVAYYFWQRASHPADAAPAQAGGRVTPVVAVAAKRGDLSIYLDADGTVAPLNMVVLRTRIDGQLISVNFKEGQEIHQGDLLAEIDPKPIQVQIEQAKAQQAKDQAALENAQRDLERYQKAQDAVPQQQLDTAAAQVSQGKAQIKTDQAVIDAAELQLKYTKIISPIDGRIGLRNIDAGNIVHTSDANGLATVAQVHPIAVIFTLAQDTLPQVQKALRSEAKPVVLAYDSGLGRQLAKGILTAVDNQIDQASGTYKLKATFDNTDNALFPDQMVNVRLLVDTRKDAVLVPPQAVQQNQETSFVYVIKDDQTVEMRTVTPGPTEEGEQVIEKGLEEGESVVIDGLDRLTAGSKVKAQTPEQAAAASQPAARGGRGGRGGGGGAATRGGTTRGATSRSGTQPASSAGGRSGADGGDGAADGSAAGGDGGGR